MDQSSLVLAVTHFGEDLPVGCGFETEALADVGGGDAQERVGRKLDVDARRQRGLAGLTEQFDFGGARDERGIFRLDGESEPGIGSSFSFTLHEEPFGVM